MATVDRLQGFNIGVAVKPPCVVASTAALILSGAQTVDGISVGSCERILVKNQADLKSNGIYIADTSDWRRGPDWDGKKDAIPGTMVYVDRGNAYGRVFFAANSSSTAVSIDIGSTGDEVSWSEITPSLTDVSAGTVISTGSTTPRALEDRFAQIVDFKDHGATADGVTNDTVAMQAALDSGTKQFALTSGTYLVAELEVPEDVVIHDFGGVFKFVLGTTPSGLDMAARSKLLGVRFDVSGADSLGTSAVIDIEGADVVIDVCDFDGQTAGPSAFKFNYCVRLSDSLVTQRLKIRNNTFKNTYFGIIRQNGTTGDASHSQITGNTLNGVDKGDAIQINIGADVNLNISGNIIDDVSADGVANAGMGIGLAGDEGLGGAESSEIRRVLANDNIVGNTERGIHVEGCNKINVHDNIVYNVSGGGTEAGIQFYGSDEYSIVGNTVTDCTVAGIQVQAESTDQSGTGKVSINTVKDCPTGIHVDADIANSVTTLTGNVVQNASSKAISVQGDADYNITGNGVEDSVLAYKIDAESASNSIVLNGNTSTNNTNDRSFLNVTNSSLRISGNDFIADSAPWVAFAADDATPDVAAGNRFKTIANSGATAITNLDGGIDGQVVTIKGGSATNAATIADSGSFRLTAAITLTTNTVITLLYDAALVLWTEQSRSVN